jgi:hypothetical protein
MPSSEWFSADKNHPKKPHTTLDTSNTLVGTLGLIRTGHPPALDTHRTEGEGR